MKEKTFAYIVFRLFSDERSRLITAPDEIKRMLEKIEKLTKNTDKSGKGN